MIICLLKFMILCSLCMKLQKLNPFLLYKTCIFELKSNFLFIVTKKMAIKFTFFKSNFILNSYNKINEFVTWTNCPIQYALYNILLICIFFFFLQVLEGNSKLSYFFPKLLFIISLCSIFYCI